MKIFVNDKEITIFHGAKVLDVIRAYYTHHKMKWPCQLPIVTDAHGNSVASDGELREGNHLYIKTKNNRVMKTISTKLKVISGIMVLSVSLLIGCSTSRKAVELPKERKIDI